MPACTSRRAHARRGWAAALAVVLAVLAAAALPSPARAAAASSSPLVFASDGAIYATDDGSARRLVVEDDWFNYGSPALSPDGRRVVFTSCAPHIGHPRPPCKLATAPIEGGPVTELGIDGLEPRWAPDGRRLVFTWFDGSLHPAVFIADADGSGARQVAVGQNPDWSPDGSTIVFVTLHGEADPEGRRRALSVYDVASGAVRRLTPDRFQPVAYPRWAPDGTRIAATPGTTGAFVTIINADGSGARRTSPLDDAHIDGPPAWSPDGSTVAVTVTRATNDVAIEAIDLATSAVRLLLADAHSPNWATPAGPHRCHDGYWLAAADGGIFTYGNATFHGSAGNLNLNAPIVAMTATPTGDGYWLAAADGGIFTYGNATFHGSAGNLNLNAPIVAMTATPTGDGYWLAAADGGIFTYGNAPLIGSAARPGLAHPATAFTTAGGTAVLAGGDGTVVPLGTTTYCGSPAAMPLRQAVIAAAAAP